MSTTTPDLTTYHAVHRALRSAPPRMVGAVAGPNAIDPADRRRTAAFGRYWKGYVGELLAHHTIEDEVFFPVLVAKVPVAAELIERTDAEHHRLDGLMARTSAAVAGFTGPGSAEGAAAELVASLGALGDLLDTHLAFEDDEIIPLFARHFDGDEYHELDMAAQKHLGIGTQAAFSVPFIVDALSDIERPRVLAEAPMALRVLHRLTARRFARLEATALGPAAIDVEVRS